MDETKKCNKCKIIKPVCEFYPAGKAKAKNGQTIRNGKYQSRCKACISIATMAKYYKHHKKHKERKRIATKKFRQQNQINIFNYLINHPCTDCGETDPVVLEFDHIHGKKLFNISQSFTKGWETILNEIEKCEVVCSNCHKKRTSKRSGNWYKALLNKSSLNK